MRSTEQPLSQEDGATLLEVARTSVAHGLDHGTPLSVVPREYAPALRAPGACFVTLHLREDLRGCTGTLEVRDPLVVDVAYNAHRSAFDDPRFSPLTRAEYADLDYHISVLSPLEPLPVDSEEDLLRKLRPGIDGLVLHDGTATATFLPAVWQTLPDPKDFVAELKRKAGLPANYWSDSLTLQSYAVLSFTMDN